MRKVILSVIPTLVIIGLILGGGLLYLRGQGFSAREEPTWMERIMARNARKIATPADAKNLSATEPKVVRKFKVAAWAVLHLSVGVLSGRETSAKSIELACGPAQVFLARCPLITASIDPRR